jgi:RNA polymerase sigma-70 factor (ECF subfamily)
MDVDPDLQLVKRCQAGDISAFDSLVRRHKDEVYRLVCKMLGNGSEVDDAAQEIFLRAYRRIGRFRCQSSFSTWLTRIAVNYSINYLRNRKSFRFFPAGVFSHGEQRRSSVEPQMAAEHAEKYEKVYQAINLLSLKQRAVIILHYFEDHSCEEIAGILDCSIGTVKSRLFHARRALKKRLEPYLRNGDWIGADSEIGGEGYEMFKM